MVVSAVDEANWVVVVQIGVHVVSVAREEGMSWSGPKREMVVTKIDGSDKGMLGSKTRRTTG